MIILGVDPGIATTGYAIIKVLSSNKLQVFDYGCIKTHKKKVFPQRLSQIHDELTNLIKKYKPDQVAVETIYFAKNAKTVMKVSEGRGVVILAAAENGVNVMEFTPLQVKQALTGYGRASKEQIQKMVKSVLNLKKIPKPDDVADALAIAITCAQTKSWRFQC